MTDQTVRLADGVEMPLLGLGVWQVAPRGTARVVEWALAAGYRHIDTAALYKNEEGVGAGLRASGLARDEVFITTKFMPRGDPDRELAASLDRLGLDYVDLYLIHWPTGAATRFWDRFEEFLAQGLAKAIGVSNYGAAELTELIERASVPPAVNQIEFNPFAYRRRLVEACQQAQVVVQAYSPLMQGHGIEDRRITAVAEKHGRSNAQVLLRWALQRDTVVLPKSAHQDRIQANAQIFDFTLDAADLAALDALDRTDGTASAR
ncbi:MAG TPA: aldo/keto reductase [Mycobacteriales bacterium]|nr:aldo/keto reductase [Mycobacteriales bacterium]